MPAATPPPSSAAHTAGGVNPPSGMSSYARRTLDWAVPPSRRDQAYSAISAFARERPILFSFLAAQLLLSFLPILLFATFSICTVLLSLGAALAFSLFWIGVALLVLVPTLLVTSSISVLVWAWCLGSFVIARWLYNKAPVVKGDLEIQAGKKKVNVVKDENGVDGKIHNVE